MYLRINGPSSIPPGITAQRVQYFERRPSVTPPRAPSPSPQPRATFTPPPPIVPAPSMSSYIPYVPLSPRSAALREALVKSGAEGGSIWQALGF